MQNPAQVVTVKYGDVLNRASHASYWDLQKLLQSFRDQDPELRTIALRKFVIVCKKRLAQQLALTKWLSQSNIIQFNTALDQFHLGTGELFNLLEMSTYEMYCLHSQLYSMRTLKYETELACSICGSGSYEYLPAAISRGGLPKTPKPFPPGEGLQRLILATRTKLAIHERLPQGYPYLAFSLKDGKLIVHNYYYYELHLCLQRFAIDSPWKVLHFQMQSTSMQAKMLKLNQENDLFADKELKEHYQSRRVALEQSLLQSLELETINKKLFTILELVEYSCLNFRLRQVYLLWLKFSREALFKQEQLEVKLVEEQDEHQVQISFWQSISSDNTETSIKSYQFILHLYIQKDETSSSSSPEGGKQSQKRLPYIAADLIIPRLDWRMKHFDKIIYFHTLIGENVAPADVYASLVTYFTQQRLMFLYHCIHQTIQLKKFQGTVVENTKINVYDDSLQVYPATAISSSEDSPTNENPAFLLYLSIRVEARAGRYILFPRLFAGLETSCTTNFNRFQDEINDLEHETLFLQFYQNSQDKLWQIPPPAAVSSSSTVQTTSLNGKDISDFTFSHLSTLSMVIEGMETVIACRPYLPYFTYVTEEERLGLQSLTNYFNTTFIAWRMKYWFTQNLYNQKYQLMMNEIMKIEEEVKQQTGSISSSTVIDRMKSNATVDNKVRKAPFQPPPSEDNILKKKAIRKPQSSQQSQQDPTNNSKKKDLIQESYVLYLVMTVNHQTTASLHHHNDGSDSANAISPPSPSSLLPSIQYDFYLCKSESKLTTLEGYQKKSKLSLIDRKLFQVDRSLSTAQLSHPHSFQRYITEELEPQWIYKKGGLQLDYSPLSYLEFRPTLFVESLLPPILNHLLVQLSYPEESVFTSYDKKTKQLFMTFSYRLNTVKVTLFVPKAHQAVMRLSSMPLTIEDLSTSNELLIEKSSDRFNGITEGQDSLPVFSTFSRFLTIDLDVFQIMNYAKVKDSVYIRLLIQKLVFHFQALDDSTKHPNSSASDSNNSTYSHHWSTHYTFEEKISIHLVQFLELMMKKAPIRVELEHTFLACFEMIRVVSLFLWSCIAYSPYDNPRVIPTLRELGILNLLRPLTITTNQQDIPVILFAFDSLVMSEESSYQSELIGFRHLLYNFQDNAIILQEIDGTTTNVIPIGEFSIDSVPRWLNSLK